MSGKSSATTWSLMLMATLLFGVGLGLSLGYAFFSPREPVATSSQTPPAPADTPAHIASSAPPTAPPPVTTGTTTAAAQASLLPPPATDGYWGARHLFVAVNGQWLADATKAMLREVRPGGVMLQEANLGSRTQTFALVKEIKTSTGLGEGLGDLPLIAVAQEGGPMNLLGVEDAPSAQALGENGDPELARSVGQRYGEESIGRGIAIVFAPVLDVYEPGAINPGFAARAFGTDHTQVARMALAMAEGLRQGGVLPVVKFFPGYGAATYGSDGLLVALNKDAAGLGRLLYPFDQAVRRGVPGMLVAHVAVPALDPEDPRRSAAQSPVLVGELLRARWGYDGVIVADDVAMNSMTRAMGAELAAVKALAAGCDAVIMIDPDPVKIRAVHAAIAQAVGDGTLSREKLEQSVARLDRWQQAIGNLNPIKPSAEVERVAAAVPPAIESAPMRAALPPRGQEPVPAPQDLAPAPLEQTPPPSDTVAQEIAAPAPAASEPAPPPTAPEAEEGRSRIEHTVREGEDLAAIAQVYSVSVDDLVRWNALASPATTQGAKLTVFLDETSKAKDDPAPENMAAAVAPPSPAPTAPEQSSAETIPSATDTETVPEDASGLGAKLVYTVVAGDTLDAIAAKYHVTKDEIVRWNGLESDTIETGRTLTLFLGASAAPSETTTPAETNPEAATTAAPEPAPIDTAAAASPSAPEPAPAETTAASTPIEQAPPPGEAEAQPVHEAVPPPPDIPTETYVVQPGDTISKIARQFATSRETVLRLNGLKDANAIKAGQKLRVPKVAAEPAATEPTPATP